MKPIKLWTRQRLLAKEILLELGLDATFEQIAAKIEAIGSKLNVTRSQVEGVRAYLVTEKQESVGVQGMPQDANGEPEAIFGGEEWRSYVPEGKRVLDPGNFDDMHGNFTQFIRFGAAVEACGGIEKARKYLELLEQCAKIV